MMHHALLQSCSLLSVRLSTLWITSLWQGMAIATAATLLARTMPQLSARLRYMLWAAAYLACVLLPVAECLHFAASDPGAVRPAIPAAAHALGFALGPDWGLLFALLWATGACFCFARLLVGLWAVRALLRTATMLPCEESWQALQRAGARGQVRGQVRILVSHSVAAPVATGFCRPAVVLPHALLSELTSEQMAQILRHELTHLERRDDWAALLTGCIGCLFPLHPALAWIKRRLAETRELACDDAVLEVASSRAYAASLAHVAACRAQPRAPRLLPSLLGDQSQLAGRIQHILAPRQSDAPSSRLLLPAAACALMLVSGTLVRCPSLIAFQAQQAEPPLLSLAPLSLSATTTVSLAPIPPAAMPVLHPVRRRRISDRGDHLLARTARQRFAPSVSEQPSAVLVLWSGQENGFVTAIVFDLEPARAENAYTRPAFAFLEI